MIIRTKVIDVCFSSQRLEMVIPSPLPKKDKKKLLILTAINKKLSK